MNGTPSFIAALTAALVAACMRPVAKVHRVGPLIQPAVRDARVIGQDMAYSIAAGTSTLWLFGDTFYGGWKADGTPDVRGAVSSNAAWSEGSEAGGGLVLRRLADERGFAAAFLRPEPGEDEKSLRLWPGHGFHRDGRFFVYYTHVQLTGSGQWDFRHTGQGLAVGDGRGPLRRVRVRDSTRFWSEDAPAFGAAVLDSGAWIYLYGRGAPPQSALYLARVRPERAAEPLDYEFYAGGEWSSDLGKAQPLFEDGFPEGSVSRNAHAGGYLMLYSRLLERDVVVRTAPAPWGPWSPARVIHICGDENPECYAAKEHPQFAREGGRRVFFTLVDGRRVLGGAPDLYEAELE